MSAIAPERATLAAGPATMRAARVLDFTKPLSVEEIERPEPGPGDVLVHIEASGLCHTDIHAAHGAHRRRTGGQGGALGSDG